jgi:hypothetical protein
MKQHNKQQIRGWIQEEAALLEAEDTEEETTWRGQEVSFLLWKGQMMERLAKKHKKVRWDSLEVEALIENWWKQTATPDELRLFAAYCRRKANEPSPARDIHGCDMSPLIEHAQYLEELALDRSTKPKDNQK